MNTFLYEGRFDTLMTILQQANSQMDNLQTAQQPRKTSLSTAVRSLKWKPPVINTFKANWDVVLYIHTNTSGLGGIVRDAGGNILVSFCCKADFVHNLEVAEASALRKPCLSMLICVSIYLFLRVIAKQWLICQTPNLIPL